MQCSTCVRLSSQKCRLCTSRVVVNSVMCGVVSKSSQVSFDFMLSESRGTGKQCMTKLHRYPLWLHIIFHQDGANSVYRCNCKTISPKVVLYPDVPSCSICLELPEGRFGIPSCLFVEGGHPDVCQLARSIIRTHAVTNGLAHLRRHGLQGNALPFEFEHARLGFGGYI